MIARALALRSGYRRCQAVTRRHAKSFYLASHALGAERRRGAFAVYAFCRRVDDAVDGAHGQPAAIVRARVVALREKLDEVYSHRPLVDAELLALRATARQFGIERRPFEELIDGVASDVDSVRLADQAALDTYCYRVAGTVGLMMARLFGTRSERALDHAVDLGKAMQLTNILRDVREDYHQLDRVYLPADQLRAHGVAPSDLGAATAPPGLRALARLLAARAQALYASADRGVPLIVSAGGRAATAIMRTTYSEILAVLAARDWDVLAGRAVVPRARKSLLAVHAAAASLRTGLA